MVKIIIESKEKLEINEKDHRNWNFILSSLI